VAGSERREHVLGHCLDERVLIGTGGVDLDLVEPGVARPFQFCPDVGRVGRDEAPAAIVTSASRSSSGISSSDSFTARILSHPVGNQKQTVPRTVFGDRSSSASARPHNSATTMTYIDSPETSSPS